MRHGTCFRHRLSAHHAGAAPHSAVAELGVVRRFLACPENRSVLSPTNFGSLHFMAPEYLITPVPANNELFAVLCTHLGGQQRLGEPTIYEFRSPATRSRSSSPDATVTLDPGEVWLLDHGGPPEFVAFSCGTHSTRHSKPVRTASSFVAMTTNPNRPETPNHALQRTAPCVTAPASAAAFPPAMQVPRRTPLSLSLGSLGYSRDLPEERTALMFTPESPSCIRASLAKTN